MCYILGALQGLFMIPFGKITFGEEEKRAVLDCIESGWVAPGAKTREFEEQFAHYVGANHAVFVDSGTSALFLAVQYLKHKGLLRGTVKVPSLTFTATAEEVIHAGLTVEFGDVDGETCCLSEVTENSLPVHIYGYRAKEGALIYDSAHRIEKDDMKGSDALWCYSFYATKNISVVTGGMVATNSKEAYEWMLRARDHGLTQGTKERYSGAYKQYDVAFIGWRLKGDDLRAAIGLEQLKKLPQITAQRNEIVEKYNRGLGQSWKGNHVYLVLVQDQERFVNYMYEHGVQCTVHFRPLHTMTAYQPYAKGISLPLTEYIGSHVVSLPLFPQLTDEQVEYVIKTAKESGLLMRQPN